MDTSSSPAPGQKKGISALGWVGIGCGGIILLVIIGIVVSALIVGPKMKKFAEEAQTNPTKASASMMVSMGVGEMVAEDDANKRYTIKEKQTGKLRTFYWDASTNAPQTVDGDFSAIPAASKAPDASGAPATTPGN